METSRIGIIAGGGQFPALFTKAAQKEGREVVVIAHKGETGEDVIDLADQYLWVKLGQLGKIINFFKQQDVKEAVFLGTITKTKIFKEVWPDLKGLSLWNKIDTKQDDAILRAIADCLEKEGITIRESTLYLQHLLFPPGVLTKKKPTKAQMRDIQFGWQMARSVGELDIGQCVVVRDQSVLAVEAIEGTDAAIRRGGELGRKDAVVVKVKKPNQDFRFDLPAIGITTIESMRAVHASVLAVEARQALLFDKDAVVQLANEAGIIVVGVTEDHDGKLLLAY
jgi:hypothetical protein